ncbi:hypothetical protein [Cryobacterium sp. AP23]
MSEGGTGPHLSIELGALVTSTALVLGSGLALLADASSRAAWFAFILSALAFLCCIPLVIVAIRNRLRPPPDA